MAHHRRGKSNGEEPDLEIDPDLQESRCHAARLLCKADVVRCIAGRALLVIQVMLVINSLFDIEHSRILWWTVLTGTLLGIIELAVVVFKREGREWKWFTPSILLYLFCVVPLLWALELDEIERFRNECELLEEPVVEAVTESLAGTTPEPDIRTLMQQVSHNVWKQTFLIVIVLTRWVMPKGGLSHDELSNLLFIYFAIASDIMELSIFEIFDRTRMCEVEYGIFYAILVIWTASLIQFSIPLSAKKEKRADRPRRKVDKICGWFYETEVWSLMMSVMLQDGPFFAVRVYCLVHYELYSYEIIFFTMKNALVVMLQFYRMGVVIYSRRQAAKLKRLRESMGMDDSNGSSSNTFKPLSHPQDIDLNHSGYTNRDSALSSMTNITAVNEEQIDDYKF